MKQCPVCKELFDEQKAFCDMDGAELVETDSLRPALTQANASPGNSSAWVTGVIGGLIGIIVCVLLYLVFLAPGRNAVEQERRATETKETSPVTPGQVAVVPANKQEPAAETPSPTEAESPAEEAPSPSPAAPAATPAPAALNNGPISTGTRELARGDGAIIKMKDGSSLEADAAWEDAQGIWFRRSSVVSFLEKSRVEAIIEPQRKPAAAETKTP